jgi:hypothetical protein
MTCSVPGCGRDIDPKAAIWAEWNALAHNDEPAPVKRIAANLGLTTAEVAAVVYPAETFGVWADDQEPPLEARWN